MLVRSHTTSSPSPVHSSVAIRAVGSHLVLLTPQLCGKVNIWIHRPALATRNMKHSSVWESERVSRYGRAALWTQPDATSQTLTCVERGLEKPQNFHLWTHKMRLCRYIRLNVGSPITDLPERFSLLAPPDIINTPIILYIPYCILQCFCGRKESLRPMLAIPVFNVCTAMKHDMIAKFRPVFQKIYICICYTL